MPADAPITDPPETAPAIAEAARGAFSPNNAFGKQNCDRSPLRLNVITQRNDQEQMEHTRCKLGDAHCSSDASTRRGLARMRSCSRRVYSTGDSRFSFGGGWPSCSLR